MRKNSRRIKKRNIRVTIVKLNKILIPFSIVFIIVMISTIFAITNSISERVLTKIKINGIDIGNLTINEAYEKLNKELKTQKSKNVIVKYEDYETEISLQQLEVSYNIIEAINEAYKVGKDDNIIKSNYQIIFTQIFGKQFHKEIQFNEDILDKVIEDITVKVPGLAVENSYYIENNNLIILKGKPGINVKREELKKSIIQSIENQINKIDNQIIQIQAEEKQPEQIDIQKIYNEVYTEAKDAYYDESAFDLHKEVQGINFDIEVAKQILSEEKQEYVIPLIITDAKTKIADLTKKDFFPNQLSKYTTRYDENSENRTNNIKLASEKINNVILMPGEVFSYNKIVGERTIRTGYKEAAVYMNGKVVDGIGGGICQVSSTLYNAVLEANLEIVERKNHHFIVSYVPVSKDATVSYGTIDFKFKNNRKYPIKIECLSRSGMCEIKVSGIKEEVEYEVVIENKTTEVIPYTTRYIENNSLEKGVEREVQKGVDGYKSEGYRVLKLNGKEESRTLLSKDSYNPLQRIIEKGTK